MQNTEKVRLRSRGSRPLSIIEKIEAQEKSVQSMEFHIQGMEFCNSFHTHILEWTALNVHYYIKKKRICLPCTSKLDWVIASLQQVIESVAVFCNFKSLLMPSPDSSPLIPIPIVQDRRLCKQQTQQSNTMHTKNKWFLDSRVPSWTMVPRFYR